MFWRVDMWYFTHKNNKCRCFDRQIIHRRLLCLVSHQKWIEPHFATTESTTLCNWILDFLTNRPQTVRIGGHTSFTLVLNTGATQGCVLSPLLFTLYTHDCSPRRRENSVLQACGRHHRHRPDYKEWRDFISRWNQQSCTVVHQEDTHPCHPCQRS